MPAAPSWPFFSCHSWLQSQLKMDKFFEVQFEATRKIQSKRIRRVVNRFFHPSTDVDRAASSGNKDDESKTAAQDNDRGKETREEVSASGHVEEQCVEQGLDENCCSEDTKVGQAVGGLQKQESKAQKRSLDQQTAVDEEIPAKRTRLKTHLCSATQFRGGNARCLRSTRGRGRWRSTAHRRVGAMNLRGESSNPQRGNPTLGRNMRPKGVPARGRGRLFGRSRGTTHALKSSQATEHDSTSSDSDSNDNCYKGPSPACVVKRGRPKGRPGKRRGRGRPRATSGFWVSISAGCYAWMS